MTDPRGGDPVGVAAKLPKGSGIIFRHYDLPHAERMRLFNAVRRVARKCRHTLLLADRPAVAHAWGADGAHHRSLLASQGLRSVAVHSVREAVLARAVGANLIFVSPVFATASHPQAKPLGRIRLGLIAGPMRRQTIALGGMSSPRANSLSALKVYGWAGIDALSPSKG